MARKKQLAPRATDLASADEPPVVARLVVEVRSDGKRTVARGSLEEPQLGERTSIRVEGTTPSQLVLSLVTAFFRMPAFAGSVIQTLLAGRSKNADRFEGESGEIRNAREWRGPDRVAGRGQRGPLKGE